MQEAIRSTLKSTSSPGPEPVKAVSPEGEDADTLGTSSQARRPRLGGSRAFTAIRNRFVAINLPLILIATLGLYAVSEWMVTSFTHLSIRDELHRVSSQISRAVNFHVVNGNKLQIKNVLAGAAANADLRGVEIRNAKGNLVASIGTISKDIPADLRHTVPIYAKLGSETKKVGSVAVALSTNRLVNATDDRRQIVAIIALCLAMIAVVIGMMVQEWTVRAPLKKLNDAIREREKTGEKVPVDWKSSDELGQVTDAFNELQDREEMYMSALKKAHDGLELKVEERTRDLALARDQARDAVDARDAFMAKLSHELRTPLNAIIGFSEMIGRNMPGAASVERHREYAWDIHHSGEHLLCLIDDLLDISRVEMGKHTLSEDIVPLDTIVGDCVQMVRKNLESHGHVLDICDLPAIRLRCDPTKIRQVLLNLLSNAVKFTRDGGLIEILSEVDERGLWLHVTDSGPGIPDEDQIKIFEPFRQAETTVMTGEGGVGLGLSLARSFIELHGGRIDIYSKVGRGTCMSILLPPGRLVELENEPEAKADKVAAKRRPRIRETVA
jgi:signal transduction histidine kinase